MSNLQIFSTKEADMEVKLHSRVRRLCDAKGWDLNDFIGLMRAKAKIGEITARKIYEGDTSLRVETAAKVALLLGVTNLSDVIEIKSPPVKI